MNSVSRSGILAKTSGGAGTIRSTRTLEQMVHKFVAGMVRVAQQERHEAEQRRLDAERHRQEEVFRRKHLEELALLKGQIEGEELRVRRLEEAASNWIRAKHIRDYAMALIESKIKQGYKLVPSALCEMGDFGQWSRRTG